MKVIVGKVHCLRCGHTWIPRKKEIRICAKCKSAYFDTPLDKSLKVKYTSTIKKETIK